MKGRVSRPAKIVAFVGAGVGANEGEAEGDVGLLVGDRDGGLLGRRDGILEG